VLASAIQGIRAADRAFEAKAASVDRASVHMAGEGASKGGPERASAVDDVVRDIATLGVTALQLQANVAVAREADRTCGTILDLVA